LRGEIAVAQFSIGIIALITTSRGNPVFLCGVYSSVRAAILLCLALLSAAACAAETSRYLATLQERWDASDLVCIGIASAPVRTGFTRTIDGIDRDQLVTEVEFETCLKGKGTAPSAVRVVGYDARASKDVDGGFVYSGPPTGFVRKGRNLLFLRRTKTLHNLEIVVPIYETAIRLADSRPNYAVEASPVSKRFALTQEFEAALVQFDASDVSDIDRIVDLLGIRDGMAELSRFSQHLPLSIQRDIAVALLLHDQLNSEPLAISLLQDTSAPAWKRANAAEALGQHGTERALPHLHQIALQPTTSDDLKSLQVHALSSLHRLESRLGTK